TSPAPAGGAGPPRKGGGYTPPPRLLDPGHSISSRLCSTAAPPPRLGTPLRLAGGGAPPTPWTGVRPPAGGGPPPGPPLRPGPGGSLCSTGDTPGGRSARTAPSQSR